MPILITATVISMLFSSNGERASFLYPDGLKKRLSKEAEETGDTEAE